MLDIQNAKVINLIPPVAIKDNSSWTATEIDTLGYHYLHCAINLGATDIAAAALKLQESDTSGSGGADITGLIFGTSTNTAGSTSALPTAGDDGDVFGFDVDLRGRKRYITLVATAGNGTVGTYASGLAFLFRPDVGPTTAAERGFNQVLRI